MYVYCKAKTNKQISVFEWYYLEQCIASQSKVCNNQIIAQAFQISSIRKYKPSSYYNYSQHTYSSKNAFEVSMFLKYTRDKKISVKIEYN